MHFVIYIIYIHLFIGVYVAQPCIYLRPEFPHYMEVRAALRAAIVYNKNIPQIIDFRHDACGARFSFRRIFPEIFF